MPEFDESLPLEWRGEPGLAVVVADLLECIGQGALASMGAQSHVEMKDAFLLGFDPAQEFLRQPLEVFAILNRLLPAGFARSPVDEQHFDVRGVAELAPSEFPQAEDGEGAGCLVCELRASIGLLQLGAASAVSESGRGPDGDCGIYRAVL